MPEGWLYANITTNATTVLKPASGGSGLGSGGHLHSITVNNAGSAWVITVYDSNAGSGTKIATLTSPATGTYQYDVLFSLGLTVVTSGTTPGDVTIAYR